MAVLTVNNLYIDIHKGKKMLPVIQDMTFQIKKGEIMGIAGESGCGKSMTALALMGLLPKQACVRGGEILYGGRDLACLDEKRYRELRNQEIAIIFQEPMSALNPLMTVGRQIEEAYVLHHSCTSREAYEKTVVMMGKVGLPRPESLYYEYPHRLSGGMKQRIVIAMALINSPKLIIADEPTTALDVTIQFQILMLIKTMAADTGAAVLLISHDLGVMREICGRIMVMYAGKIVEEGETAGVLSDPLHPYTQGLLASMPLPEKRDRRLYNIPGNIAPLDQRSGVGCSFADRCPCASDICFTAFPALRDGAGRKVLCHKNGGFKTGAKRTA